MTTAHSGDSVIPQLMRERTPSPAERRQAGIHNQAGFSLLEVLVASFLLLIVLLGVVPMFTRSMVSNVAGNEYTKVSNQARTRAEEFRKLPFNSVNLTVDPGTTEKVLQDFFSRSDHQWKPGEAPVDGSDPALWERTTTVRQYGIGAFLDGTLDSSEALDGGSAGAFVHVKEVEVSVQGQLQTSMLGVAKDLTVRVLKFK